MWRSTNSRYTSHACCDTCSSGIVISTVCNWMTPTFLRDDRLEENRVLRFVPVIHRNVRFVRGAERVVLRRSTTCLCPQKPFTAGLRVCCCRGRDDSLRKAAESSRFQFSAYATSSPWEGEAPAEPKSTVSIPLPLFADNRSPRLAAIE